MLALCCSFIQAQQFNYPGNNNISDTPQLFAEGIISDGLSNRDFAISPKGDEIFFTIQQPKFLLSTILYMKKVNNQWSKPKVASFSGVYRDLEASFSPDGETIYFSSDRPANEQDSTNDFDIWRITKSKDGSWNNPEHLDTNVNSAANEFYPSVSKSGNLYFTVEAPYGKGKEDIVMCRFNQDHYEKPVSLSEAINSAGYEFNAFIDADEQFIIFTGYGRKDDLGGGDLYISRKDAQQNWQPAVHLSAPVNSVALDYCPYVSPDKTTFFFTSNRAAKGFEYKQRKNYSDIKSLLSGCGNGLDDIYIMNFSAVK